MNNIFSVYPALSSLLGAILTLLVAFIFSKKQKDISVKTVFLAIGLELALLICLIKTSVGELILYQLVALMQAINGAAQQGITFVFGALGTATAPWGFIFALHVLPVIIFFSALISVLSYLGVIDVIIRVLSSVIRPILGTSKPETASAVAKSFLGPTEAQLFVRDYLPTMSDPELFTVMVSGLSMISASVFAIYMEMGAPGNHLIAANLLGIPGSLLFAKIIMPSENHKNEKRVVVASTSEVHKPQNLIGAIIQGTLDGLQLVLAIGAILISFLACIALLNSIFVYVGSFVGIHGLTFQDFIGYLFAPCGILTGLPTQEAFKVSELIGIKFISNEMVAFSELSGKHLSERGLVIATYALCGFANIACVGIVVGGLSTLMPTRRSDLGAMAWYALLAATLSNLFSAYLVGIFL
jgi:concentrative nucleoside transporter, CNT family